MQVINKIDYNDRNGWGIGGAGTYTIYDNGLLYREGRYQHRHTGTSSQNQWYVNIEEDFDIQITGKAIKGSVVHVYEDGTSYRACFGKPKSIEQLFNYPVPNAKLIKTIPFNV